MAVATIQDCVPGLSPDMRMALAPFNDVILPEAGQRRLPILNLRSVCVEPTDYAGSSPIEFLAEGGRKIAAAIEKLVRSRGRRSATGDAA